MLNKLLQVRYFCRTILWDVLRGQKARFQFINIWNSFWNDCYINDSSTLNRENSITDIKCICFAPWVMVENVYKVATCGAV